MSNEGGADHVHLYPPTRNFISDNVSRSTYAQLDKLPEDQSHRAILPPAYMMYSFRYKLALA